jgi:N-methylhydantoinase B/oxoprolinase/acetone carboxylase alpha subunit
VFDYFQEGLHVPPVKPWKGGEEQEDILAIILANTRMAESMLGDLRAQRNSLRVGEVRMIELSRRYGFQKFIIVVPSVAIREGVLKNIEITAEHPILSNQLARLVKAKAR